MEVKNIKAFQQLIQRYETITLKEIKEMEKPNISYSKVAHGLTGFGSKLSCTLCQAVNDNCCECVYRLSFGCFSLTPNLSSSYKKICDAETAKQLLSAFRNRAKVMRKYVEINETT